MLLHIFNPDHDESLADYTPYYTPRRAARLLADALATLPAWWADRGDLVLVPPGSMMPESLSDKGVRFVSPAELTPEVARRLDGIAPWGWNPRLRHRLTALGIPPRLLPDDDALLRLRTFSSRLSAVKLLQAVQGGTPSPMFRSRWCTSREELAEAVEAYGQAVAKAPWSGSGRGVFRLGPQVPANLWQRAWHLMQAQGAVEVELFYDRIADFAAEFSMAGNGHIRYEGLSLFSTAPGGAYTGNVVASQERLLRLLLQEAERAEPGCAARTEAAIKLAVERLQACLPSLAGAYRGPLGVDLMLVRTEAGHVAVHPCVEINVRLTMGWVALHLARHLPEPEAEGRFQILQAGHERPAAGKYVELTPPHRRCQAFLLFFSS